MTECPPKVVVQDANVLIDLEVAGLFDLWFQTGIETHTTDLIRAELSRGGHHDRTIGYFRSGQIHEHTLAAAELEDVAALADDLGNRVSFEDCSVLFLARKIDAALLSGDKALRSAGEARHIEVRGTLWIFDVLVEKGLLSPLVAVTKLQHLMSQGRHLPKCECRNRLQRWSDCGAQTHRL